VVVIASIVVVVVVGTNVMVACWSQYELVGPYKIKQTQHLKEMKVKVYS